MSKKRYMIFWWTGNGETVCEGFESVVDELRQWPNRGCTILEIEWKDQETTWHDIDVSL